MSTRITVYAGPGIMFVSAVLFGFFGFVMQFNSTGTNGQTLIYIPMFVWTMRISAMAFGLAGFLTFVLPLMGNLIYSAAGLLGAIMFVVIAVMDLLDQQHTIMAYAPFILVALALFNGWGSVQSIRAIYDSRRSDRGALRAE